MPCRYCETGVQHPVFVSLITVRSGGGSTDGGGGGSGGTTYVFRSCNPCARLHQINQGRHARTAHGAPNWELELVIGPFPSGATVFKQEWQRNSRKRDQRILYGISMVNTYNANNNNNNSEQNPTLLMFSPNTMYISDLVNGGDRSPLPRPVTRSQATVGNDDGGGDEVKSAAVAVAATTRRSKEFSQAARSVLDTSAAAAASKRHRGSEAVATSSSSSRSSSGSGDGRVMARL